MVGWEGGLCAHPPLTYATVIPYDFGQGVGRCKEEEEEGGKEKLSFLHTVGFLNPFE